MQSVAIVKMRIDGGTQPRATMDWVTVADYAEAMLQGAAFPPVVVFFDGADYWLADGFHRVKAAEQAGWTEFDADIRQGTIRDAILYSVGANATHGMRRTNEDKRQAAKRLLQDEEWARWSDREIAKQCAVSHTFVAASRAELSLAFVASDNRSVKYVDRWGREATMNRANIGNPIEDSPFRLNIDPITMADRLAAEGRGLTEEEWASRSYEYLGYCEKQCYASRIMTKGDVFEYGARGVYVCSGCGYAYPPMCEPGRCEANAQDPCDEQERQEQGDSPVAVEQPSPFAELHFSSDSVDCYTPLPIVARVLEVLEEIDLDPCSNSHAEPNVPARQHYTQDDDGLSHPWLGRVYMNPPYGRELPAWIDRLCSEYEVGHVTEAIALVPARTDTEWFRRLREYPRCFIFGRLRFVGQENSAPFPSMAVYMGNRLPAFMAAFQDVGDVYRLA